MDDETNIIAWGDWATALVANDNNYLKNIRHILTLFNEQSYNINIKCPNPVVAEYYFNQIDNTGIYTSLILNTRIHIINCGENFATGALISFIKNIKPQKTNFDLLILYIPPTGTNNSTIGRFFAEILADTDLFDYIALIDSCSPKIKILSDEKVYKIVASIASILSIFDRSCSIIPILKLLNIKISSFMFSTFEALKLDSFKSIYFKNNSVSLPRNYKIQGNNNTFIFSVSHYISKKIKQTLDLNYGSNKYFYIPFLKRFEWKKQDIPVEFVDSKKNSDNYICVLSNIIPSSVYSFLIDYYKEYWIDNGKHVLYEKIGYDSLKWLESLGVKAYNTVYASYTLNDLRMAKDSFKIFNPYLGEKE